MATLDTERLFGNPFLGHSNGTPCKVSSFFGHSGHTFLERPFQVFCWETLFLHQYHIHDRDADGDDGCCDQEVDYDGSEDDEEIYDDDDNDDDFDDKETDDNDNEVDFDANEVDDDSSDDDDDHNEDDEEVDDDSSDDDDDHDEDDEEVDDDDSDVC